MMANAEDFHHILIEQAHLLSEASETLENFIKNISGFFNDLTRFFENKTDVEQSDLMEFKDHSNKLKQYIDQVHAEIPALNEVIQKTEKELQESRKEIADLKNSIRFHKEEADESMKKYEEVKSLIDNQSTYSATMGSVLATMLWKTSKTHDVIETFIDTGTLNQFLNIAAVTLTSFRETYDHELPVPETHEFKFICSIFGIYINILAQRNGRDFVLEREVGLEFVKLSLKFLGEIQMSHGQLLKRLILMMLYNLSISKRGSMFIEVADKGIENIIQCQNPNHSTEIQSLSLTLMTLLLTELPEEEFCDKVMNIVSQHDLQNLLKSTDENVKLKCKQFVAKLQELGGGGDTSMDD